MEDAVGFGVAVQHKAPALRREAAQIDFELGGLAVDADRQLAAVDRSIDALRDRAETLLATLGKTRGVDNMRGAPALEHRRAALEEEILILEQRRGGVAAGAFAMCEANDRAWSSTQIARRTVLRERIAVAEARQVSSSDAAQEQVRHHTNQLLELRQARAELSMRSAAANSAALGGVTSTPWQSRYEAVVAEQGRLADRVAETIADESVIRLEQAVAAAASALEDASEGAGSSPPQHLVGSLRCVRGLAEAERRRSGLLTERWHQLQGEECQMTAPPAAVASPAPVPPSRSFSPSRAGDWDLDALRDTDGSSERWGFSVANHGRLRRSDL